MHIHIAKFKNPTSIFDAVKQAPIETDTKKPPTQVPKSPPSGKPFVLAYFFQTSDTLKDAVVSSTEAA